MNNDCNEEEEEMKKRIRKGRKEESKCWFCFVYIENSKKKKAEGVWLAWKPEGENLISWQWDCSHLSVGTQSLSALSWAWTLDTEEESG